MPEITLTPPIELLLNEHINAIAQARAQQERDLKIIFACAGIEMPKDGKYKLEKGKLTWEDASIEPKQ